MNAVVYDAERAALGVSVWNQFTGGTQFVYFKSVSNQWQPTTSIQLENSYGIALSPDGKKWIATQNNGIVEIDANSLALDAPIASPDTRQLAEMSVSNDGKIAVFVDYYFNCGAHLWLYDFGRKLFSDTSYSACRGDVGASADGSKILIASMFDNLSNDNIVSLDTITGTTTKTGIQIPTDAPIVLDRSGSRIVLDKANVYDGSYNYLGKLPSTTLAVVLAPDGGRAYTYDQNGMMRTYDLLSSTVAEVFPEVGTGTVLAANPGFAQGLYVDAGVQMVITPDGKTVFIAGSNAVVVQPTQ